MLTCVCARPLQFLDPLFGMGCHSCGAGVHSRARAVGNIKTVSASVNERRILRTIAGHLLTLVRVCDGNAPQHQIHFRAWL